MFQILTDRIEMDMGRFFAARPVRKSQRGPARKV